MRETIMKRNGDGIFKCSLLLKIVSRQTLRISEWELNSFDHNFQGRSDNLSNLEFSKLVERLDFWKM